MLGEGDRLGDYEVLTKLDSGGMATLFLGRRVGPSGFARPVAIKVLHANLSAHADFAQMFIDEARISVRIGHPNVVHVEDLGKREDCYYIVMEYIPGSSLAELLRALAADGRGLRPELATWVAMEVAAGLHGAHETRADDGHRLGLVHRDVNPRNILLGANGHIKLIDFGIAKARGRLAQSTKGVVKGTLRYMSPEQARGKKVDRRSDIYSLGVVLWEMLTMRRLIQGKNDLEIARQLVDPRIVPPSTVRPELDPKLDLPVLRALSVDPEKRYETAAQLRKDLARAVPDAATMEAADLASLLWAAMPERMAARASAASGMLPADLAGPPEEKSDPKTVLSTQTCTVAALQAPSLAPPMEGRVELSAAKTRVERPYPADLLAPPAQEATDSSVHLPMAWGVGLVAAALIALATTSAALAWFLLQ